MKRKTIALCLLLVLLSAIAVVGGHWYFRRPPIDRVAFDKIEVGMTKQEVEAICGQPTGSMTKQEFEAWRLSYHSVVNPYSGPRRLKQGYRNSCCWRGTGAAECTIYVMFDGDGIVVDKEAYREHDPSLVDRARKWLGWK